MKSPVSQLGPRFFWLWIAFAFGGPLLSMFGNEFLSKLGNSLICMSFGFVIFGLGLKLQQSNDPAVEKVGQ